MSKLLLPVLAVLLAGCVTTSPITEPSAPAKTVGPAPTSPGASAALPSAPAHPSTAPASAIGPSPTPSSPRITVAPSTATVPPPPSPTPASSVSITAKKLIAWKAQYSSYVNYYVIAEIKNEGTMWAQLSTFDSDYTIYDGAGKVTTTGTFTYAYPDYIGPGDTGYLIEDSAEDGLAVSDFATLDVNGRYGDVDGPPDDQLVVSNATLRSSSFGGGWEATGEVTNTGTVAVDSAHAGAVYFDAAGNIIGASTTNLIENVEVGQTKGFRTIDSNPLKKSDIDSFVVFAVSEHY